MILFFRETFEVTVPVVSSTWTHFLANLARLENLMALPGRATATGGMELHACHAFQQFRPTPSKFKTKLNH